MIIYILVIMHSKVNYVKQDTSVLASRLYATVEYIL